MKRKGPQMSKAKRGTRAQGVAVSDEDARKKIRESLDESLLVEAAAGTGKTTELVQRIVAVLAQGKTTIDRLVAVTFTRKASGELKLRLREELDQTRAQSRDPSVVKHLQQAVSRIEEARVGTIHSFCADLLRERPVEANVDPAFLEMDEDGAEGLFQRAFRSWIEQKLSDPTPGLQRALNRCMIQRQWDSPSPLDRIQAAAWKLADWRQFPTSWQRRSFDFHAAIDDHMSRAQELSEMSWQCKDWKDELWRGLRPVRDLATWVRRFEKEKDRDYSRLEASLVQLLSELKRPWNKKKGTGPFSPGCSREQVWDARVALVAELESFKLKAEADLAAELQAELGEVTDLYEGLKRKTGQLDFMDLLVRTRDLIRDRREIRRYFQEKFTHIFVDEFQDTDPLQAEILLLLSADSDAEADWRRVQPAVGKLFLVGDPKQSIYRFRRADIHLYHQIKESLRQKGVGIIYLSRSFRSVRSIQNTVNAAFETEMQEDTERGQPSYVALQPHREDRDDQPAVVALPVPKPYGSGNRITNKAIDESLPQAVAAFIDWLIKESLWQVTDPQRGGKESPVAARHICVLFRRFVSWTSDITRDYTRALESRRINHVLVGSRSFHHREEVETLRVALSAIEWPDDELSVYATLRGSLFWIRDSSLLKFRHRHQSLHPFLTASSAKEEKEETEPEFRSIRSALATLSRLHKRRNRRPIVDTVNELLEVTRAHAGFALRPAGSQVLANVQRVCDLARGFEARGGISFRSFVDLLDSEAEKPVSSEAPIFEEGVDGVRLMTVHSAKGLEFPIVILADMTAKAAREAPDRYLNAEDGLAAFQLLGCTPWDLLDNREGEHSHDEAEATRIAYVAATRARDLLVVPTIGTKEFSGWFYPLNRALYPQEKKRHQPAPAPACPPFGSVSVLGVDVEAAEQSVQPGLHRIGDGDQSSCGVVWWDPAVLNLRVEEDFGLQQQEILSDTGDKKSSKASIQAYERWKARRAETVEQASAPSLRILTVTGSHDLPEPPDTAPVRIEIIPRPADRPGGVRFGTLVHTILRDVRFDPAPKEIQRLARLHGQILDAPDEEIRAAEESVRSALGHDLLARAASASRCHRELPILLKLDDPSEILEGNLDLAFLEESKGKKGKSGRWIVVDFKTDADLEGQREHYTRQLSWYVHGLSTITKTPAEGWLLGV